MMRRNDIKGQAGARRALEVACVGGHSIMLVGPRGAGKHTLLEAYQQTEIGAAVVGMAVDCCPCGNYQATRKECPCSARLIARYWRRLERAAEGYDILLEVPELNTREYLAEPDLEREKWEDTRVKAAWKWGGEHTLLDIKGDDATRRLYEMAVDRCGLTLDRANRMVRVARSIANLAESERIQAKHLAEAAQYSRLPY